MSGRPKVSAALSNVKFAGVSRQHPDFFSFVKNTIATNRTNKGKWLGSLQKEDWDMYYLRGLQQAFPGDPFKVEECIRQAKSPEGTKMWQDKVQRRSGVVNVSAPASWTEQCLALNLPSLSHPTKSKSSDQFDRQSYSGFAESLQKRNQHVMLTKALVDEAFRLAASKMPKRMHDRHNMERMCDRCLGPESSKYWKDR